MLNIFRGFPGSSDGKESACNAGDLGSIPGSGRSPGEGNGNPLQDSCLENPMDRGAWWVTVHRVAKSQAWLRTYSANIISFYCYEHMIACFVFFFLVDKLAYIQGTQGPHLNLVCRGCPQAPANSVLLLTEGPGLWRAPPQSPAYCLGPRSILSFCLSHF